MPLLPSALPPKGEARRYVANDFLNLIALPIGEGGPRQRRSGALANGALETIFPALFHPARTLSGSLRSPPSPRWEGFVRRYSFSPHISCIRSDDMGIAASSKKGGEAAT